MNLDNVLICDRRKIKKIARKTNLVTDNGYYIMISVFGIKKRRSYHTVYVPNIPTKGLLLIPVVQKRKYEIEKISIANKIILKQIGIVKKKKRYHSHFVQKTYVLHENLSDMMKWKLKQ